MSQPKDKTAPSTEPPKVVIPPLLQSLLLRRLFRVAEEAEEQACKAAGLPPAEEE